MSLKSTLLAIALALISSVLVAANPESGLGVPVRDTAAVAPAYSDLRHDLVRPSFANYAAPAIAAQALSSSSSSPAQDPAKPPSPVSPTATGGHLVQFASINVLLAFAVAAVGVATVVSLVMVLQRRRQRLIHHQQLAQSDLEGAAEDAFKVSEAEAHRIQMEVQVAQVRRAQAEALMFR
ncbi:hypothetical protein BCR44DRAFT_1436259 [Catenaria anguillulae PL171]|uniref:Uncharacterized protein n=1 Tax=Catenaria anguillulae PL171 TaxID=765915 RepID=A0A1Y2HKE8_9FUNG